MPAERGKEVSPPAGTSPFFNRLSASRRLGKPFMEEVPDGGRWIELDTRVVHLKAIIVLKDRLSLDIYNIPFHSLQIIKYALIHTILISLNTFKISTLIIGTVPTKAA